LAIYLYEHMFPWSTPSPLTRRVRNALSLARSFLLLEDDYDVDWEVDWDEPGRGDVHGETCAVGEIDEPSRRIVFDRWSAVDLHPHRVPLRGRSARERTGQLAPVPQVCLCPVRPHGSSLRRADRGREGESMALR
jgi:hypothetical protein